MKKRMVVAMGWLLMALLLLPVGAMAQVTHNVKIKVRFGKPVATEATVTIKDANGNTYTGTNPDRNGVVIVENVPVPTEGTVTVWTKINGKDSVVTAPVRVSESGSPSPNVINFAHAKPVEVTVVDAVTNRVIEGATVAVGMQDPKTNGDGKVTLSLLRGKSGYPVLAKAAGYADGKVKISVNDEGTADPSTIELKPLREVTIKVLKNGQPEGGAVVTIVDANGKEYKETAGPTGDAVVQNVPVPIEENGTVTVEVGGKKVTAPVKVDKDGKAEPKLIDISQAKPVVVTVVDVKDERIVIQGATVAVGAQEATVDTYGKVTLSLLGGTTTDPVQYRMVAKKDGYADSTVMRKVDNNGIADPSTIKLTPVRDVTITVVKDGKPVKKATVTIVDDNGDLHERKTDDNGNVSMRQVPVSDNGTVTVKSGSTEVTAPVKVTRDGTVEPSTIDLQNPNIASVAMTVVNEWGVPIPSCTVTVGAQDPKTDNSGKVTLSLLGGTTADPVQYQMVAKGPAIYDVGTVVVSVNADGIADPNTIELKQKERVTITVVNNDQPENGAPVTIVDAKGNKCKVTTGSNGEADIPKMTGPTEWTVTVEKGGKVVTVPVKVGEDGKLEPDRIDIAKPRGVEVTVFDAVTGKGIKGATVTVGAQTVTAGDDGKVVLNLQEDFRIHYQVVTTADGYAKSTERRRVKAYNGSSTLTLGRIELMSLAGVTIKVTDNGAEVPDATVTIEDVKGKEYKGKTLNDGMAVVQNVPVLTEGTVTVEKNGELVTGPVKVKGDGKAEPDNIDISQVKAVAVTVVDSGARAQGLDFATVTVGAQKVLAVDYGKATLKLLGGTGVKYLMKVEGGNYVPRTVAVSVNADGIADPDTIELKILWEVPITVRNNGSALIGADVTIVDENGKSYTAKTNDRGGSEC